MPLVTADQNRVGQRPASYELVGSKALNSLTRSSLDRFSSGDCSCRGTKSCGSSCGRYTGFPEDGRSRAAGCAYQPFASMCTGSPSAPRSPETRVTCRNHHAESLWPSLHMWRSSILVTESRFLCRFLLHPPTDGAFVGPISQRYDLVHQWHRGGLVDSAPSHF
jgi:hypothetical protein